MTLPSVLDRSGRGGLRGVRLALILRYCWPDRWAASAEAYLREL